MAISVPPLVGGGEGSATTTSSVKKPKLPALPMEPAAPAAPAVPAGMECHGTEGSDASQATRMSAKSVMRMRFTLVPLQRGEVRDEVGALRGGQRRDAAVGVACAATLRVEPLLERGRAAVVKVRRAPPNAEQGRHLERASSAHVHGLVVRHLRAGVTGCATDACVVEQRVPALSRRWIRRRRGLPRGDGVDPIQKGGDVLVLQRGAAHAGVEDLVGKRREIAHVAVPMERLRSGDAPANGLGSALSEIGKRPDVTVLTGSPPPAPVNGGAEGSREDGNGVVSGSGAAAG